VAAIGIISSVDGIVEHVLQGCPVGPAPLKLSFALPLVYPHSQLQAVFDQVAEYPSYGSELLELTKHQRNDLLDLLVGVENYLAGGLPYVADGHGESQLSAPGFGKLTLMHALLNDVQLCLAHGAFEAEQ
jgi:hypothetical protein